MKLWLLFATLLVQLSNAAVVIHEGGSCGTNSIPYKIVVDSEGKPEIFCDIPACFGIDENQLNSRRASKELSASCDPFKEVVCVDDLQWTGGLLEVNNGTHRTLKTECCSYDGMESAQTVKSIFLGPGDSYVGGVVDKSGEVTGFDLIKEVRKTVNAENQVQYIIAIYRMACSSPSQSNEDDVLPILSRNKRKLRERLGKDEEYEEDRYRPLRRRPFGARRRALLQRLEDYYDYDYDFPQFRRPFRRSRLPANENRLWPVQYQKPRAYGDVVYQEKPGSLTKPQDETSSLSNYGAATAEIGPIPPPVDSTYIESQNIAPANSYVQPPVMQTAPVAPPADSYAAVSYPAYPSYPSSQYSGYPAQQVYQPAAQPAYSYPAYQTGYSSPNLNGIFSRTPFQCFSGDMEVETEEGLKLIKDLKIGDKVLSIDETLITFSPIIMFLHKRDDELAEFNLLETEHNHSIKLTDNHLIYISNCVTKSDLKLVAAKDVKIGDCIHITTPKNVLIKKKVSRVSKVAGVGIYSPLTSTGDIIVNRVLSSCHSNLALKSLQQTFFSLYKRTSDVFHSLNFFNTPADNGNLPFGIETITSVMDLFIPQSFV